MPRAGRKTKRFVLGCGLVVVVATVAAVVWLSWPRERLLMEIAHPVVAIDTRHAGRGHPIETVSWVDSHRLLIITTEHIGRMGITDWKGHAELFDTATNTRTRLVGLTKLLNRPGLSHGRYPLNFQFSPVGTRLCWCALGVGPAGNLCFDMEEAILDGTEPREWQRKADLLSFWIDDHHFVGVSWDQPTQPAQLSIHDTRVSHSDRVIKPSSAGATSILRKYDQNHPLRMNLDVSDRSQPQMTWWWFDLRSGKIVNRTDIFALPKNTQVAEGTGVWILTGTFLHRGTVPILLQRSETPPMWAWLHRFIPAVSVKPIVTEGLWVRRADIQHLQEIGHIPARLDKNNDLEGDQLEQAAMVPDGKRMSFVYRGMLYLVPVKPQTE
jgi:hypothetical protein